MNKQELVSADEARGTLTAMAALRAAGARSYDVGSRERFARTVIALYEIIEGRTAPPTDAELAAHAGVWMVLLVDGRSVIEHMEWPSSRDFWRARASRWWPMRDGRPCAWPEVRT